MRPAGASAAAKVPVILVIHENRGLNPYIEDVARRLGTALDTRLASTWPGYDEAVAKLAWQRTLTWFDTYLRG